MLNLSQEIYRKIDLLIPDLQQVELFTKMDMAGHGLPDIYNVVFESTTEAITFVLACHVREYGRIVANPYFEISVLPKMGTANVVTYGINDNFRTTKIAPTEIAAQLKANQYLYDWLHQLTATDGVGLWN